MPNKRRNTNNWHDYVIKEGKFIGDFETMYKKCDNPWPEDIQALKSNPVSSYTVQIIRNSGFKKLFTVGSGKGYHANWLKNKIPGLEIEGCEISKTAVKYSRTRYPDIKVHNIGVDSFGKYKWDFDLILFREILWYILPYWEDVVNVLKKKYKGKYIILEITCYDKQRYGLEYFDGPEEIIKKFPFEIKEILRRHTSIAQREGMILIFGRI